MNILCICGLWGDGSGGLKALADGVGGQLIGYRDAYTTATPIDAIVAHSLGGSTAIKIASQFPTRGILLLDGVQIDDFEHVFEKPFEPPPGVELYCSLQCEPNLMRSSGWADSDHNDSVMSGHGDLPINARAVELVATMIGLLRAENPDRKMIGL